MRRAYVPAPNRSPAANGRIGHTMLFESHRGRLPDRLHSSAEGVRAQLWRGSMTTLRLPAPSGSSRMIVSHVVVVVKSFQMQHMSTAPTRLVVAIRHTEVIV